MESFRKCIKLGHSNKEIHLRLKWHNLDTVKTGTRIQVCLVNLQKEADTSIDRIGDA